MRNMAIQFREYEKFKKDFKKLQKRYPSLEEDFVDFKKVLELDPTKHENIPWLWEIANLPVYKARKFVCKSLKSTTKLRLIYVYDEGIWAIEFIEFIEIYAKSDKAVEDKERILEYFKSRK